MRTGTLLLVATITIIKYLLFGLVVTLHGPYKGDSSLGIAHGIYFIVSKHWFYTVGHGEVGQIDECKEGRNARL